MPNKNINEFTSAIRKWLLLLLIVASTVAARTQNVNNPNKWGPLGTQVNTLTGNLYIGRTDIYIPARTFDLDISFSYNSFLFTEEYGYGKGWTFEYNIKYSHDTTPGARLILWGNGREDKYDSIPGGGFRSPKGFFSTLSQYQPNKYLLTELNGIKYFFDNAVHKRITRVEEPNGNFINFTYTDSLLTAMTNAAAQSITFTYNVQGRLATVVDAVATPSRTFNYTYDASGNLKEVKDPLDGKYQYTYLVNGPMKSLADKNNNKVDIIYFPDMTIRELVGCNKRLSFSYDTTIQMTIVTDHLETGNQVTKYTYKTVGDLSWITSMSGNCCGFNVSYEYDDQGNQTKMTDANGQVYTYTYDSLGNMLTATDPLGNVNTYTYTTDFKQINSFQDPKGNLYTLSYDANGNLTQLITPGNNIYTATYNATGDIITSTDPKGNTYTYGYDSWGNPTTVTGPNGYNAILSFDARGHLLSYTDARGNDFTGEYDILSRLKKITDPINNFTQFNYDPASNLTSYINKNNETILLNYDASNRLVKVTGPTGNQASLSYDGMNNLTGVKDALGHETKYSYDNRNRMKGAKDAANNNAAYSYDGNGNVTHISLPNGRSINIAYDQLNRVTSISDASGTIGTYAYDKNGNVTSYTNATGAITTAVYDSLDRIKKITDPLGNNSSFIYDKNNNIISATDREGRTSHYTYDDLNRVKTYTDKNGFVTTVDYDAASNIISLKDQNNNITTYTYDELDRRKTMTYPDGKYMEYDYDKKNNVTSIRRTDGTIITYQYDILNRVISRTLPEGEVYSFTYDKLNRVLTATNSNGTITFTYDAVNRITSESFDGRTINYNYNIAGRTQTTIYPDSTVITKEFDTRNRLIKILKNNTTVAEYAYNNANQLTGKTFANGVSSLMQYDFANRLSSITTGTMQNSSFTYDKVSNKTAINRLNNPSLSEQFTYDNGYRLTNYKRGPAGSPVVQNTYTYDAVGNRTTANLNGTATTYGTNNLNQLTGVNGTNFTFDDRGNLTYDGIFYKTYDAENRLVKDSSAPASVVTYGYDALNRRITKTINGNTLKYTYSGAAQIEERDNSNTLLNRTVFNGFLSPVLNEKDGSSYYYHQNELNSVEAISNSNGRLIESYRYDVYGKLSKYDSLNNPLTSSIAGNRFGFTGQEYDSTTGSYRFFFRNYSPETGVFNQRDLIEYKDGMGMYQYVGNNPANGIDVWGLQESCGYTTDKEYARLEEKRALREVNGPFINTVSDIYDGIYDGLIPATENVSDAKNIYEPFGFLSGKQIPGALDMVTSFVGLPGGIAKTKNSFVEFIDPTNSPSEYIMHGGELLKHSTTTTLDGAAIAGVASMNPAGLVEAGVAKGINYTIWGLDKSTYWLAEGVTSVTSPDIEFWQLDRMRLDYSSKGGHYKSYDPEVEDDILRRELIWNQYFHMLKRKEFMNNCENVQWAGTRKKFRVRWDPEAGVAGSWILDDEDPNLIVGPDGQPDKKWVSVNDRMPYTIFFENDTTATAKVRYIKITAPIELKHDPVTFELGSFGFNNQTFDIPARTSFYSKRLDCRDSTGLYVDITAGYDVINNQMFWEFQGIDPVTMLPPEDPLIGFLFLPDTTQKLYGHGFVNFSMKPLASSQTLDTIGARASIVFGTNEIIPTNIHTNTIDALPPASQLNTITGIGNSVTLNWTAADDAGGSGIDHYTVYVSADQVNYSILFPHVVGMDTTFTLPPDSAFCFFVLGTDRVGNVETMNPGDVACRTTQAALPVTWLFFNGTNHDKDNLLKWATVSEQNSKEFRLERSLNGRDFNEIAVIAAAGNSTTTRYYDHTDRNIDKLNSEVMYYRLKQVDIDSNLRYSSIVRLNYKTNGGKPTIVYPNPTEGMITLILGDKSLIGTEASIMDINGRVLKQIKLTASSQTINISDYVNGVYLVRLSNKETLKIVKQ